MIAPSPPRARTGPNRQASRDDAGSVTLFAVAAALALFLLAGLVVDGGAKIRGVQRADALAAEAARAGGQAIVLPASIQGLPPRADPAAAAAEATAFLTRRGVTGTATLTDAGRSLEVTVTTSSPTVFLSLIGISDLTVTGQATATLVHGVTGALP